MPKHLYLVLFSTFLAGFLAGVVILLQTRTGGDVESVASNNEEKIVHEEGVTIRARMYGGCLRIGCPSYQINSEGVYVHIGGDGVEDGRSNGTLSQNEHRALVEAVKQSNLEALLKTTFKGTCPVTYDGVAYTFEIIVEGTEYLLDSCKHTLSDVPVFTQLENYFDTLADLRGVQ